MTGGLRPACMYMQHAHARTPMFDFYDSFQIDEENVPNNDHITHHTKRDANGSGDLSTSPDTSKTFNPEVRY